MGRMVARANVAICNGQNQFGEPIKVVGSGMLARCLQHETNHVNGVVMEDHLSAAERTDLRAQHNQVVAEYRDD